MRRSLVRLLLSAFLVSCSLSSPLFATGNAPSENSVPVERLSRQVEQAKMLADKHAYSEAAAVLERLASDIEITTLPNWPDTFYLRAQYEALAGNPDKAMTTLAYAADLEALPLSDKVANEPGFTALHVRPEFKALVARLQREEALWKDSPALVTPFKPVLSEEEKVAGLSKIWSEARFNFPFFGRIDVDWDAQYMAFLPQVREAKNTEDYYRVLTRFVAILRDGHTRLVAPKELNDRLYAVAPLTTRLIEGKVIVTEVEDQALAAQGIVPGVELVAIDGRPALDYARAEVEPYVFGFSPQDRTAWIYGVELLRGPLDKSLNLSFSLADSRMISSIVRRRTNRGGYFPETPIPAEFKMLPGNIAYLRIQEFTDAAAAKTLRENIAAVSNSSGLIIDIRLNGGGRDENMSAVLAILGSQPFPGLNWRSRDYIAAVRSWRQIPGWKRSTYGRQQFDSTVHYTGSVIVLTSGTTYSSAEHFVAGIRTMKRGTIVGETTGGSISNPMVFKLPGGGMTLIGSKDDYYPDGELFNGTGIKPDVAVSPTIADIRAGRDRALEKAVEMLKAKH